MSIKGLAQSWVHGRLSNNACESAFWFMQKSQHSLFGWTHERKNKPFTSNPQNLTSTPNMPLLISPLDKAYFLKKAQFPQNRNNLLLIQRVARIQCIMDDENQKTSVNVRCPDYIQQLIWTWGCLQGNLSASVTVCKIVWVYLFFWQMGFQLSCKSQRYWYYPQLKPHPNKAIAVIKTYPAHPGWCS